MDIHTKLMRRYKQVPEWWFICILIGNIGATIYACEYYNEQLQLPWWGVILACAIAIVFTLPIGIITAITNQVPYFFFCILGSKIFGFIQKKNKKFKHWLYFNMKFLFEWFICRHRG